MNWIECMFTGIDGPPSATSLSENAGTLTMIISSAHPLVSTPSLAVPMAVLLLASINALMEGGGHAARNAIIIARSALGASALAFAAVLGVGPLELAAAEAGGPLPGLSIGPLQAALILMACITSLLIAQGTLAHPAPDSQKDNTARGNITVLLAVVAMMTSGGVFALLSSSLVSIIAVLGLESTSPGILSAGINGRASPAA